MQEAYRLRKFREADLRSVAHMNRVCLPENYTDIFFADLHRRFPETFIVAEKDGEDIGYIMCRVELGLSNYGLGGLIKKGHIVSVAVMPDFRCQGVGSALVIRALEGMKFYGAKQSYLEVRVTNDDAVRLYEKLGFKITRTIQRYYADGESAYVMSRKVRQEGE